MTGLAVRGEKKKDICFVTGSTVQLQITPTYTVKHAYYFDTSYLSQCVIEFDAFILQSPSRQVEHEKHHSCVTVEMEILTSVLQITVSKGINSNGSFCLFQRGSYKMITVDT